MKRVYIAGAYSDKNVIKVLENMREGIRLSTEVFLKGFAPFCPWMDYHYTLMLRPGESLSIQDYYEYSLAWLRVADAVLVNTKTDWVNSRGTRIEIGEAKDLGIPIFYTIEDLICQLKP